MDCAVVGAGPAGLAVSAALTVRGVDHVVLTGAGPLKLGAPAVDSFRLNLG
jgi:putative flavoprotein involved in K+ transport